MGILEKDKGTKNVAKERPKRGTQLLTCAWLPESVLSSAKEANQLGSDRTKIKQKKQVASMIYRKAAVASPKRQEFAPLWLFNSGDQTNKSTLALG